MLSALFFAATAWAANYNVTAGNFWQSYLTSLQPGDILTLLPQTPGVKYTYTVNFRNGFVLNGSPTKPIIVQGAPGEDITMAMNINQNVVEVEGQYFLFQNLRLTATSGAPGAIGLRLVGNASNAIIRGVTVFNIPETAFTANTHQNRYVNITFDGCEAYNTGGTGECFYVGCQPSSPSAVDCEFINGALINNYCHDTCVPNGCSGGSLGSGYQVKGWGSYGNLVQNNVCNRVSQVCILLYDDFDLGPNIVDGNLIYGSIKDAGIQVSAGAIIRNNIIYNNFQGIIVTTNGVNLAPGKQNRNIVLVGNTLVNNGGKGLTIPTLNPTTGSRIVNNVVIEDSGSAFPGGGSQTGVIWQNNAFHGGAAPAGVGATGVIAAGTSSAEFENVASYNFHPKTTGSLVGAGAALTSADSKLGYGCVARSATPAIGALDASTSGGGLTLGFQAACGSGSGTGRTPTPSSPSAASGCLPEYLVLIGSFLLLALW